MHFISLMQTKIVYLDQAQSWLGLIGHVAHHYMYTLERVTDVLVVGELYQPFVIFHLVFKAGRFSMPLFPILASESTPLTTLSSLL